MVFRTISCIKQAARVLSTTSHNVWFKLPTDVYQPGHRLSLILAGSKSAEVKIVKAFTPFTNSVALLVDAQSRGCNIGLPDRFVLKLADRRVYPSWSIEREKDYQSNISDRGATLELSEEEEEECLPWMEILRSWKILDASHIKEHEAYVRLKEAQVSGLIPRFFGTTKINMMTTATHSSLSHIYGLLLEYIPGRSMARYRPGINITLEEAEIISQRVLELGRRLRRFGILHCDVHVGNIILREQNHFPVLIDWGCAIFRAADLPLQERWVDPSVWTDFHRDIRYLLRTGAYYKGPNDDPVHPTITAGGIWHRFRTPVSDEELVRLGEDVGYGIANRSITSLSAEEKALFYDEDTSVDVRHGLRFKVKKGIKTRKRDDPCPAE